MATITDLNGNKITEVDLTSVGIPEDSNVNVFEFGNLILADILPTIIWLINYISDLEGSELSIDDSAGNEIVETEVYISNSEVYDFSDFTYEPTTINYDGYALQGVVVDISGS